MNILSASWLLPICSGPIVSGAIAIEEDKIVAVGPLAEVSGMFPNAPVEKFGDSVIMPGLVNCHSHLELTSMRGFLDSVEEDFFKWLIKLTVTRDEKLTPRDIQISAAFGALEGARAGVTCFGDIGRNADAGMKALKLNGLRGVVYLETKFSPSDETAVEDFSQLSEEFKRLRANETPLVKVGISPHSPFTVSSRLFELITEYSIAEDIKITIHAAESKMEEELLLNGSGAMADLYRRRGIRWQTPKLSPIEYLSRIGALRTRPLLAHCIRVNDRDLELIRESDSSAAHCPKSNAKFGHRVAPLEEFLSDGIRVGLGSDSVASNNTCDILEESRFALLAARSRTEKKRLLTARELLETATIGGARAMRLESEIGTLEAGKQADLIVVSLGEAAQQPVHDVYSALVFASNGRDVRLTVVAGREIYRGGRSLTIDEDELKIELRAIARRIAENES